MAMELLERMAGITRSDPPVYYDVVAPKDRSGGRSGGRSGRPWLVPVHGGAHTGSCYLTTADGRPGWAHVFADRGFPVAVPDWPGSGRSAPVPLDALGGETVCRGLAGLLETLDGPVVLMTHSMSGVFHEICMYPSLVPVLRSGCFTLRGARSQEARTTRSG